jgi:hypothetical protein
VSQLATLMERGLLATRTPDDNYGVLALARRQAILGRLEGDGSASGARASIADIPEVREVAGRDRNGGSPAAAAFAPLPAAFGAEVLPRESDGSADRAGDVDLSDADLSEVTSASTVASVLAAANSETSLFARTPAPNSLRAADVQAPSTERAPAPERESLRAADGVPAHLVADTRTLVTPARPEPFMPKRRPEFPDDLPRSNVPTAARMNGGSLATATVAAADPLDHKSQIERDPSVNKSLLLRLIAGVRGL